MVLHLHRMKNILEAGGIPEENIKLRVIEGGEHNEAFWGEHFLEAFEWLVPQQRSQVIFKISN